MKVTDVEDREKPNSYCEFLIKLGDGNLPTDETGAIQIPDEFLLPPNDPNDVLKWVYDDKPPPLPEQPTKSGRRSDIEYNQKMKEYDRILNSNTDYYKYKASKNVDVDK